MKLNRYGNLEKFITDPDKLVLNNGEEVIMSGYGDYCITFDMEDAPCGFEELRGFIAQLAKEICELDNIVQKYACHEGGTMTDYELSVVCLDKDYNVHLVYEGTKVANVCEVMFEKKNGRYYLRKFGWVVDIPDDWTGFHTDMRDYTAEHGCIVKRKPKSSV
ncbi:MAG: hypothetical protein K2J60_19470 [Acetatifactor sp.]|nr:hypothetical protein [Acetatifactor sp.]